MMKMTMKRLLSLVLVVTMVLTMVPGTFVSAEEAAKPTFSVDNVAAMAGESVYIPVRITENTGFGAVVLRFTLPEGWTMESIDDFSGDDDIPIPYDTPPPIITPRPARPASPSPSRRRSPPI